MLWKSTRKSPSERTLRSARALCRDWRSYCNPHPSYSWFCVRAPPPQARVIPQFPSPRPHPPIAQSTGYRANTTLRPRRPAPSTQRRQSSSICTSPSSGVSSTLLARPQPSWRWTRSSWPSAPEVPRCDRLPAAMTRVKRLLCDSYSLL